MRAIDGERRRLAAAGDLDRLLGIDRPGMEEIEVAPRRVGEVGLVGQAGGRILGREAGDVVRGAHRLLERGRARSPTCSRCRAAGRRRP